MIHKLSLIAVCLAVAFGVGTTASTAQQTEAPDPFEALLYSPELVMKHQTSIQLNSDQRQELITEITQAQADLLPRQMEMAESAEVLAQRLAKPQIDEHAALGAAKRIMELESEIKQRHLRLAIRIKNLLTEEQQKRLDELRP